MCLSMVPSSDLALERGAARVEETGGDDVAGGSVEPCSATDDVSDDCANNVGVKMSTAQAKVFIFI